MADWFFTSDPLTLALLLLAAFAAGVMDSIAGGGGIITVPALLAAGLPPASALATNKLQAPFGSGMALYQYGRQGLVPPEDRGWSVGFTAVGAVAGTWTVRWLPSAWLAWIIPGVLALLLVYLLVRPQWGQDEKPARWRLVPFYAVFGLALGFYDGFLGPGTGTFWVVALTGLRGYGLAKATAQTKVANFTSNLVSLVAFVLLARIYWGLGLLMGAGQMAGARVGSSLALTRGARFIRWVVLAVAALTLGKLLWTALV